MLLDAVVFPFGLQKWRKGNMTKKNIDLTTVGGRIKAKRLEAGMTQEQLAEKLFVKFSMVSRYERSESNMGIDTLKRIADALGCSASYLLEGVDTQLSEEEEELMKIYKSLKNDSIRKIALEQMKALCGVE